MLLATASRIYRLEGKWDIRLRGTVTSHTRRHFRELPSSCYADVAPWRGRRGAHLLVEVDEQVLGDRPT